LKLTYRHDLFSYEEGYWVANSSTTDKQAAFVPPGAEIIASQTVDAAQSTLSSSGYTALRRLRCSFHEGVLTISGSVSRYYLKQIAHALVRKIDAVEILVDHIEVVALPIRSDMQEKLF
jgi:hypothetical protein